MFVPRYERCVPNDRDRCDPDIVRRNRRTLFEQGREDSSILPSHFVINRSDSNPGFVQKNRKSFEVPFSTGTAKEARIQFAKNGGRYNDYLCVFEKTDYRFITSHKVAIPIGIDTDPQGFHISSSIVRDSATKRSK